MDYHEKRKHTRFQCTLDVEFDISTHQNWIASSARNFSEEGMCLLTREHIPIGSLLLIRFRIPDLDTLLDVTGEVVWNGDHTISNDKYYENGIKFIEIKSSYKELIGKYINGATFKYTE